MVEYDKCMTRCECTMVYTLYHGTISYDIESLLTNNVLPDVWPESTAMALARIRAIQVLVELLLLSPYWYC